MTRMPTNNEEETPASQREACGFLIAIWIIAVSVIYTAYRLIRWIFSSEIVN